MFNAVPASVASYCHSICIGFLCAEIVPFFFFLLLKTKRKIIPTLEVACKANFFEEKETFEVFAVEWFIEGHKSWNLAAHFLGECHKVWGKEPLWPSIPVNLLIWIPITYILFRPSGHQRNHVDTTQFYLVHLEAKKEKVIIQDHRTYIDLVHGVNVVSLSAPPNSPIIPLSCRHTYIVWKFLNRTGTSYTE